MICIKRLSDDEVLLVCKDFIKGRGFACNLSINKTIKQYLLRYGYINTNDKLDNYYFLTDKFYHNYKNIINKINLNRFEKELIKHYNPFYPIYFDEELMHLFLNNPKFHFTWNGYRGYVCSSSDSKLNIYIKDLCLCHDLFEDKIVIGIFLVDLIDLSYESKMILQPYMLDCIDDRYEFHYYNIKNLMYGDWLNTNEEDIYTVLLEGIKIVNFIFEKKYGFKFYKHEYEFNDLQFFMPLFYPTKINKFNFLMELYKLFLDNINKKSLNKKIKRDYDNMTNNKEIDLLKLKNGEYGSFSLFSIYFGQYKQFNKRAFDELNNIREIRTEPAHKIYTNDLDYNYCKEQDEILLNIYRIINNIIKVEDVNYKYLKMYENGSFECFYGEHGSILQKNGFNAKEYLYYDGYLRLNNDKFQVRDAEILIAGNDKEEIKNVLTNHIAKHSKIKTEYVNYILDICLEDKICLPDNRELRSFFYGYAYMKYTYGECKNFKSLGKKLYQEFLKKNYRFYIIFADSSELYWNIDDTIDIIKNNKERLFGCGLLLYLFTNNFAQDDSNIFLNNNKNLYMLNNVWD